MGGTVGGISGNAAKFSNVCELQLDSDVRFSGLSKLLFMPTVE